MANGTAFFTFPEKRISLGAMYAFDSIKNSGFKFRKFPVTNGRAFSGISGKEVNPARYTEISEICYRKFRFH